MAFENNMAPVPDEPTIRGKKNTDIPLVPNFNQQTKPQNTTSQPKQHSTSNHNQGMSNPIYNPQPGRTSNYGHSMSPSNFYVPKEYFDLAYTMFPDAPKQNIQYYLPEVLKALVHFNISDPPMVLMALATIRVETGKFEPINEFISKYNTAPNGQPYALYDFRTDIGNNAVGDGVRYCGRGFIQLTGKANYQQYSRQLGLGDLLMQQPDQANNPVYASLLLGCFLKNHEGTIRQALTQDDYVTARKAVNGGSHGLEQFIASYQTGANQIGLA